MANFRPGDYDDFYEEEQPPKKPPKKPMSTGAKVGIGCGIAALVLVLILFGMFGCTAMMVGNSDKNETRTESADDSVMTEAERDESAKTDTGQDYTVGQTADFDGVKVTLRDVVTYPGDTYATPAAGNEYIRIGWTVDNGTDEDFNTTGFMTTVFVDGTQTETAVVGAGDTFPITELIPDSNASGYYTYEVPTNWQKIQVRVKANALSDDQVMFNITPDQVQ